MPDKEQAKYRLRLTGGAHTLADKGKPILGPDGRPTGRFERVHVRQGGEFDSDVNLSALEPERYQLVSGGGSSDQARKLAEAEREVARLRAELASGRTPGDPTPQVAATSPAVAPGGQVSTGSQQARGAQGSGPLLPAEAAKRGGAPDDAAKAASEADADDGLDEKTVAELKEEAAAREVDLHGAKTRDDILKRLRG